MKSRSTQLVAMGAVAACCLSLPAFAETSLENASVAFPRAPVPIAFKGGHELGVSATRQRILSQRLGYTLTVDAAGTVTECALDYEFRLRATQIAMCRPFVKHMTFEPALDAAGNPVVGKYEFDVDFSMMFTQDGYLEERFRS